MNIIEQHHDKINGILSTFDRIIINGYLLPLQSSRLFLFYLIKSDVKLVDFKDFAESQTNTLCTHIENYILTNDAPLTYLPSSSTDKDSLAKSTLASHPDKTGLIAAFSTVELCRTMTVVSNKETKKLEVASRNTKCKYYYLYFNDTEFGWMFIKVQTWFPYNVQVYFNGRFMLSKILDEEDIKYDMYFNSFSNISDFERSQNLADGILNKRISDSLDGMIKNINPHLDDIENKLNHTYYWCIDQCEFATDICFKDRDFLSTFYKKLVETSYFTFNSHDIYSFFGRSIKHISNFKGELTSDLRNRKQGFRIKFKLNKNQIKMYDKGNCLRIEVTINNPKEFKVLKKVEEQENEEKKWVPMGKSISNLYRYAEISKAIIKRYIEALPTIDSEHLQLKTIQKISKKKEYKGRTYSSFNVFDDETLRLFQEIAKGQYEINGFNNKLIRANIYDTPNDKYHINRTTRLFSKLKAHGMIKKVPHKNRYYLSKNGRLILDNLLLYSGQVLA